MTDASITHVETLVDRFARHMANIEQNIYDAAICYYEGVSLPGAKDEFHRRFPQVPDVVWAGMIRIAKGSLSEKLKKELTAARFALTGNFMA